MPGLLFLGHGGPECAKIPIAAATPCFLKPGILSNTQPDGPGRVVSVMPEAQGTVRYRVRFQHENFERSVALDDIDAQTSTASRPGKGESLSPRESGSRWINLNTIKIRK